jgi:NAD(P)-dependent dehydrogenase (short-subunit alcohol dehydrogenase family)
VPSLRDRCVLITGAAGGQGVAVARRFAREGARVALSDLDGSAVEALVQELRGDGADAIALPADVRDEDAVEAVAQDAVNAFGGLDVLYSNAGVYWPERDAPVDALALESWEQILAINTTGTFLFAKHALPHLVASGSGVLLTVASVAAYAGDPECHAYAASKGALIALTLSIAQHYGPQGVRAVVICPGFVDTPMVAPVVSDGPTRARIAGATALRRIGQPDEIASTAVFLASAEASFVTGSVISVHGGLVK